jgi:hypothetical protein
VFVLALYGDEERVQSEDICRDRGLLPTLGDTRSSPHPSVVALGCLDVRGKRGEQSCYWTAQSITWRASMKDKCYSQRPKKGTTSKTYRCLRRWGNTASGKGPLLDSREVQGSLAGGTHKGTVGH